MGAGADVGTVLAALGAESSGAAEGSFPRDIGSMTWVGALGASALGALGISASGALVMGLLTASSSTAISSS